MNKLTRSSVILLATSLAVAPLVFSQSASAPSAPALPSMGVVPHPMNVMIVNLDLVPIGKREDGSSPRYVLKSGDICFMARDSAFVSLGINGQRVLVRSRQIDPGHNTFDDVPYCSDKVLFWVSYEKFLVATQEYTKVQRQLRKRESPEERDRRVIREILNQQLKRK